jgi:hypothetical protein
MVIVGGFYMSTKYEYNVFFKIEERGSAKVLVDNDGYLCGIYATYKQAKEAMPKIRRNLIREFKRRDAAKKLTLVK